MCSEHDVNMLSESVWGSLNSIVSFPRRPPSCRNSVYRSISSHYEEFEACLPNPLSTSKTSTTYDRAIDAIWWHQCQRWRISDCCHWSRRWGLCTRNDRVPSLVFREILTMLAKLIINDSFLRWNCDGNSLPAKLLSAHVNRHGFGSACTNIPIALCKCSSRISAVDIDLNSKHKSKQ